VLDDSMSGDYQMLKFTCIKCGYCCEKLMINTLEGTVNGLTLFQDELKNFTKDQIVPCRGIGRYPEYPTFNIILYQLNIEPYPHLKKENKTVKCRIYKMRVHSFV
jgi:Fe-S-cluster containining protein